MNYLQGNAGKIWIWNSVLPTELFIVQAIFVNPHQHFISDDKADWTRAIKQNTILTSNRLVEIGGDIIYLFEQFAGNLRHGLQRKVSPDGHDGGSEGDPTGTRGGSPLYGHQGGLSSEGPQTC